MTFITAANEVSDLVAISRFSSLVGVNDDAAFNMIAIGNAAGAEIARRADWRALLQTAAVAGSPHALPGDFQRLAAAGAVRLASGAPIRPVSDAGHWAVVSAGPSASPWFFLRGGQVLISPASAAVGASFDYYSTNWVLSGAATRADIDADDNTFLFPERLLVKNMVWRWRRRNGLAFDDHLAEFEADLAQEIAADGGQP